MGARATRLAPSRLLLFNICSSSVLLAVGDLTQQRIEGHRKNNWSRTCRMATVGALVGAMNHSWYSVLDRALPGVAGRTVVKKLLADQLIYGPIALSTFLVGTLAR